MIECTDDRASLGNAYIAVDWDPTALHLRYQTSQERVKTRTHAVFIKVKKGCLSGDWTKSLGGCKTFVNDDHILHSDYLFKPGQSYDFMS